MWKQQQCRNRPASLSLVASCWASGSFGLAAERVEQAASDSLSHGGREEGRLIKLAALKPPEPVKPVYAPGSMEYERQQAEKGD
jgi:hypothetical protein